MEITINLSALIPIIVGSCTIVGVMVGLVRWVIKLTREKDKIRSDIERLKKEIEESNSKQSQMNSLTLMTFSEMLDSLRPLDYTPRTTAAYERLRAFTISMNTDAQSPPCVPFSELFKDKP